MAWSVGARRRGGGAGQGSTAKVLNSLRVRGVSEPGRTSNALCEIACIHAGLARDDCIFERNAALKSLGNFPAGSAENAPADPLGHPPSVVPSHLLALRHQPLDGRTEANIFPTCSNIRGASPRKFPRDGTHFRGQEVQGKIPVAEIRPPVALAHQEVMGKSRAAG